MNILCRRYLREHIHGKIQVKVLNVCFSLPCKVSLTLLKTSPLFWNKQARILNLFMKTRVFDFLLAIFRDIRVSNIEIIQIIFIFKLRI